MRTMKSPAPLAGGKPGVIQDGLAPSSIADSAAASDGRRSGRARQGGGATSE